MSEKEESLEMIKVVKDGDGKILAQVYVINGVARVYRAACCSIGTYFEILSFLQEQGYEVL